MEKKTILETKTELSRTDKTNRLVGKINMMVYDDLIKVVKTVRQNTLRKLLMCYACNYLGWKNPEKGIFLYTIKSVQDTLKCSNREAYDFLNTMLVIDKFRELTVPEVYKGLMTIAESKEKT